MLDSNSKRGAPSSKHKLVMLSANNKNNIVKSIEGNGLFQDFSFCHYIRPRVGLRELLKDMTYHVRNLTREDYCLILIGEEDFINSNDLSALVQYIRESVEKISHTNLILACPTYICGRSLYNSRVERFNQLLFGDLCNHKNNFFAYDCNANLVLDMFSKVSGRLNNSGMKNVLQNLHHNINWLRNQHLGLLDCDKCSSDELFRP